jgi:formylglycine-generating enzyme required for sulfatase activity
MTLRKSSLIAVYVSSFMSLSLAQPSSSKTASENPTDHLKYVWILPGSFQMGCSPGDGDCSNDEKPAHHVTIRKGFWLCQTPVTVAAYKRFVASTAGKMPEAPPFDNPGWKEEQMPVVDVTWNDAQAYCGWARGRLPTEAEWEYAARAGSPEPRYGPLNDIAWYGENSAGKTHAVGQKSPNGFALYDTLGNVWEWVNDWFDSTYYQGSPSVDPSGPASAQSRAYRGGTRSEIPRDLRVSRRIGAFSTSSSASLGFRCVWKSPAP